MSDYAPFPQAELEKIAKECTHLLSFIRDGELRTRIEARGTACRDAIDAHNALRERCLLAELNLGQAEAVLESRAIPFRRVNHEEPHAA